MTVLAIIGEYNPFHLGHKFHLDESKRLSKSKYTISVMTGSFIQRGGPSFFDKWTRSKIAVENGVDLVIELPFIYSNKTSDVFSYNSIRILNNLNVVDYLSFGSESGDLELLKILASFLSTESNEYSQIFKKYLSSGFSYAQSREKAISDILGEDFSNILSSSNNILAVNYLKSLNEIGSKIKPITIKRMGASYKSKDSKGPFPSASGIRSLIRKKGIVAAKNKVSLESYQIMKNIKFFNNLKNYEDLILYKLRFIDREYLKSFIDVEEGLENRIVDQAFKIDNLDQLIHNISSKRYPKTRIRRILVDILLDNNSFKIEDLYEINEPYIRVLAFNKNGRQLLNKIKDNSNLDIITNFSDYYNSNIDHLSKQILDLEVKATNLFYLPLKNKNYFNLDFKKIPYIKNN